MWGGGFVPRNAFDDVQRPTMTAIGAARFNMEQPPATRTELQPGWKVRCPRRSVYDGPAWRHQAPATTRAAARGHASTAAGTTLRGRRATRTARGHPPG